MTRTAYQQFHAYQSSSSTRTEKLIAMYMTRFCSNFPHRYSHRHILFYKYDKNDHIEYVVTLFNARVV